MRKNDVDLIEALEEERGEYQELKRTAKNGRVDFLKYKDQIQIAFDKGYSAKKIWSTLSSKHEIKIGYRRFLAYFQEYISGAKVKNPTAKKEGIQRSYISETQRTESTNISNKTESYIDKQKDKPKGFVYNATPKKELV